MALEKQGGDLFAALFDEGTYTPLFAAQGACVESAFGMVGGQSAYAVRQTGDAVSAKDVKRCINTLRLASKTGNPVVTFYNSKGALLQEGQDALKAAARLNATVARLSGVVPQIAVVTGTCGASSALAAVSADLLVICRDAELFLTAPFLSAAAGDKVEDAGSAEFARKAGVAAVVADDAEDAARQAAKLLMLLPGNNLSAPASFEYTPSTAAIDTAGYTGAGATDAIVDEGSAVELYEGFGGGVVTSLATIAGSVVGVVATNGPESYMGRYCVARTARFVRLCDAFSIPVVTLLNTGGFAPSSSGDETGNLREAARLAATYADATTAKVAAITGKAVGPVFTAMGGADLTVAMQGAVVAPAEPSAMVSVLYKEEIESAASVQAETAARAKAYETEQAGADALLQAGLADFTATPATLRGNIAAALDILATKRTQRLPKKHGNMAL